MMMYQEQNWWKDKTIQVPKGLLLSSVPGEAFAVYGKMKGFGAEVRHGLDALADRLAWGIDKTRDWQKWLWAKQWIWLLREGENKEPRHWWMSDNAGDAPPADVIAKICKNGVLPKQLVVDNQGGENTHPAQNAHPAENPGGGKSGPKTNKITQTNNNSSSNEEAPSQKSKKITGEDLDQDLRRSGFFTLWNTLYKLLRGGEYPISNDDHKAYRELLKTGRSWLELQSAVRELLSAKTWDTQQPNINISIVYFVKHLDKFITRNAAVSEQEERESKSAYYPIFDTRNPHYDINTPKNNASELNRWVAEHGPYIPVPDWTPTKKAS